MKAKKSDIEEIKKQYSMTDEEIEEMYRKTKALIFSKLNTERKNANSNNSKQPIAIITGGQPGSEKSEIVSKSKVDLDNLNQQHVILDVDVYRGLYKNAAKLAQEYPEYYSKITDTVVGKIMDPLVNYTIKNNYSFIYEGTMANTIIIDKLRKNSNYRVIARLIAVSKFESLLSIFERYLEMQENMTFGRLTTIDAHNVRYQKFTEIAKTLEQGDLEVEVYMRGKEVISPIKIYSSTDSRKKYDSALEALYDGREKSYVACMKTAEERLKRINQEIKRDSTDPKVLDELKKLNSIFEVELNQ